MSTREYLKNLITDRNIASITPTSKKGVEGICRKIDFSKKMVLVEYGPATGVFTEYILKRMTPDSMLIAIELNANFVQYLHDNFNDERLKVHHDNAGNIRDVMAEHGVESADYVLSGIPFTLLSVEDRRDVIRKTSEALKEGGKFLPYQTFFQKDEHLKIYLKEHFHDVQDKYLFRNIPPMRVYDATK
ncbi:MAG TPA: methyltransferase domain-containing protein [Planococcus sp. (in: firmicutes)]|nr:methyltransferase domain-containing protein [Planococcus sp. (in: firmicutes)]